MGDVDAGGLRRLWAAQTVCPASSVMSERTISGGAPAVEAWCF